MPVSPAQVGSVVVLLADWVAVCAEEVSGAALGAASVEDMLELVVVVPGGTSLTKISTPTTLAQIKARQPLLLVQG